MTIALPACARARAEPEKNRATGIFAAAAPLKERATGRVRAQKHEQDASERGTRRIAVALLIFELCPPSDSPRHLPFFFHAHATQSCILSNAHPFFLSFGLFGLSSSCF
jgi:hypothetical protein